MAGVGTHTHASGFLKIREDVTVGKVAQALGRGTESVVLLNYEKHTKLGPQLRQTKENSRYLQGSASRSQTSFTITEKTTERKMTVGILMLLAYIVGFGTAFIQQQIKN
jgi:hypothetical protein